MVRLLQGDCLVRMKLLDDNSVDSLVTDPPAGISFMNKAWDDDKGGRDQWQAWMTDVMKEALRVMKPGAHGLVWAIPRTSHWTATALENAGFEIRDVVTHLFGTGFPKSLDVSKAIDKAAGISDDDRPISHKNPSCRKEQTGPNGWVNAARPEFKRGAATDDAKQWQGWGTALKPASEHWILVRKPCSEKTVAANVLKWGTGALNIDGSRIGTEERTFKGMSTAPASGAKTFRDDNWQPKDVTTTVTGRFPANLVLDEEAAAALDAQSGVSKGTGYRAPKARKRNNGLGLGTGAERFGASNAPDQYGDAGGASRFFYVAKASKSDKGAGNTHPTVKSTTLMEYLVKLVTPPNGTVLDPFMGSGSTGKAAAQCGFAFIGIEQSPEYFTVAKKRIA